MLAIAGRLVRRNPLQFFKVRRELARRCKPDPSATEHSDVLRALTRDGACVIPGYMNASAVKEIREQTVSLLTEAREGAEIAGAHVSCYPEYGTYHLDDAEQHVPAMAPFVDDAMIRSVTNAYGGGGVVPFNVRAELRDKPLKNDLVDDLHADTWRFRFKAILYLTDVTDETSPFRFLAGSHSGEGWRLRRFRYDYLGYAFDGTPRVERIRRAAVDRCLSDPAFRERRVTGPAGTLILFDSRILHSATTLRAGRRVILNRTYVLEEDLGPGSSAAS